MSEKSLNDIKKKFEELKKSGVQIRCSLKDNPLWIAGYYAGYEVARTKTIIEIQKILDALMWDKKVF